MKITTCCYCGTRAALVLDKTRHELSCSGCGAPLHNMKMMPKPEAPVAPARPVMAKAPAKAAKPKKKKEKTHYESCRKPVKSKRKKRRKWGREMLEEIWDVVEDIFD